MKLANLILVLSLVMTGCYSTGQMPSDNYNSDRYGSNDYNSNYNRNTANVSYQTFYDELQPYGNWISYPGYGYVWQPYANDGFRPYETDGHWVSTVDGWAWASDHNWGWAPFHYGRWLNTPSIGWAWVPGYEWAPAWVTWGRYDNYYAWAPLAPGINISIGHTWRAPSNYWSYVPNNCIQQRNLNRYIVNPNRNNIVVNNITIINNYNTYNKSDYYHRGPEYTEVERNTHTVIRPVAIASTNTPGTARVDKNNRFEIYRPTVATDSRNAENKPKPNRIVDINDANKGYTKNAGTSANGIDRTTRNPAKMQDDMKTEIADRDDKKPAFSNQAIGEQNLNGINSSDNNNAIRNDQRNNNKRNNPPVVNDQPASVDNPAQSQTDLQEIRQRRQMKREQRQQQQSQFENAQPNRSQPAFQNDNKAQVQPAPAPQNTQIFRQPQRQVTPPPANAQVQRQRSFTPQPQGNANAPKPNRTRPQ